MENQLFSLLHFNDLYDIDCRQNSPLYFHSELIDRQSPSALTLFSGDVFSPSRMAYHFKGQHMVPVLKALNIDKACFGNHDFDFGEQRAAELAGLTGIQWIMSNLINTKTNKPVAGASSYSIFQRNNLKFGIFSVCEDDWKDLINMQKRVDWLWLPLVQTCNKLAKELREKGCQVIIALTHNRIPNDRLIAQSCPDIDFILGGHDHITFQEIVNGVLIIKSGTNFRQFTQIKVHKKGSKQKTLNRFSVQVQNVKISSHRHSSPALLRHIEICQEKFRGKQIVLGISTKEIDLRFQAIRRSENCYGNFMADSYRRYFKSDLAIIVAGTIRLDRVIPRGEVKLDDLLKIIPDQVLVKKISGVNLRRVFQEGFSRYPALQGRFPSFSGCEIKVDFSQEPFKRVVQIKIAGVDIKDDQEYTCAGQLFVLDGGDGYDTLKECEFKLFSGQGHQNIDIMKEVESWEDLLHGELTGRLILEGIRQ